MPAAYMLADVVVSASRNPEGFGRVIVEAQAMGRPAIATDHGGARETIIPDVTGWLVPPRDPTALAAAIGEALSAYCGTAPTARAAFHRPHCRSIYQRGDVRRHDPRLRGAPLSPST